MVIDIVIPSYHRESTLVRLIKSLYESKDTNGNSYRVFCYVQDLREDEGKELLAMASMAIDKIFIMSVPKHPFPIMGRIRKEAFESYLCETENSVRADVSLMCDDDTVFTEDISKLSEACETFLQSKALLGVANSKKSDTVCAIRNFNSKVSVNNAYGLETLFFINNNHDCLPKLFDKMLDNMVCGEDCYMYLKALLMGQAVLVLGMSECVWYDERCWNNTTIDGGGLHEAVSSVSKLTVPKSMVGREESIKMLTNNFFQFMCADFLHYECAFRGGRRLRNDLYEYAKTIDLDHMVSRDPVCMEVDGTHRHFYNKIDFEYVKRYENDLKLSLGIL